MITITEKETEKIKSLTQGDSEKGLRIKVVGGGCSGLHYKMEIEAPTEKDKVFPERGAKVIVDKKSFLYLKDSQLDYQRLNGHEIVPLCHIDYGAQWCYHGRNINSV